MMVIFVILPREVIQNNLKVELIKSVVVTFTDRRLEIIGLPEGKSLEKGQNDRMIFDSQ